MSCISSPGGTEPTSKLSQRVHHFLEELDRLKENFQSERPLNNIKVLLCRRQRR